MNKINKNIENFLYVIYNKYNLIVYGKPQDISKNQRWKDVNTGKWINEQTGNKGEYRILGYSLTRYCCK